MPKLHSKLGFMHECLIVFSFFGARGEQLFEGEPFLCALFQDFHDNGRCTGMDGADIAIIANSIVADRIDLSRQDPLRTGQVERTAQIASPSGSASRQRPIASTSTTSHYLTKSRSF